jgi:hypothetical protein
MNTNIKTLREIIDNMDILKRMTYDDEKYTPGSKRDSKLLKGMVESYDAAMSMLEKLYKAMSESRDIDFFEILFSKV